MTNRFFLKSNVKCFVKSNVKCFVEMASCYYAESSSITVMESTLGWDSEIITIVCAVRLKYELKFNTFHPNS